MNMIRILPEKVALQIAAGEVIERPASVVRELIDNSIDAGAQKVFVTVSAGGKNLVRVVDDGAGMERDDLLLCLERHATSKISSVPDLFSIRTLGFRGEALPSIAAVSKMEILSKRPEALIGQRLKVVGGKIKSLEETGAPRGTTVEVADLFYNTPARKKFLRTPGTETDHVIDVVTRIALPFLSIDFRLEEDDKTLMNLPASSNEINRLSVLFGHEVAGSMMNSDFHEEDLRIRCYVASPDFSRARGDRILVYVNSRNVRDRLLTHAVMEGYGQRLMKGRYPQAVLFLDMDPASVDVNVHPTKQEVRFREFRRVHDALQGVINKALGEKLYHLADSRKKPENPQVQGVTPRFAMADPAPEYGWERSSHDAPVPEGPFVRVPDLRAVQLFGDRLEVIGQLKNTYILCETEDGLLMVDQHAAHERVVYERLRRAAMERRTETQPFLIPPSLELSPKELRVLTRHLDQLKKLGIEIEPFGGSTVLIRSVPVVMVHADWMAFLKDLSPTLEKDFGVSGFETLDGMISVMACHGAIRAGARLSLDEMRHLLRDLNAAEIPSHCPHGRPLFKQFSYYEIEKMFKRVV